MNGLPDAPSEARGPMEEILGEPVAEEGSAYHDSDTEKMSLLHSGPSARLGRLVSFRQSWTRPRDSKASSAFFPFLAIFASPQAYGVAGEKSFW